MGARREEEGNMAEGVRTETEAGAELGEMYLSGKGTKKNTEEGIRALTRAAASGSGVPTSICS